MSRKEVIEILKKEEQHWVGDGFLVSSMFSPNHRLSEYLSPFLLLDYASPKEFSKTNLRRGVGVHPHRGFETVTLAYKGEVEHRDSSGGGGIIKEGDVQWMTAGSGLVHEEFHSKEFSNQGGDFEMVQLWVNLPKQFKMTEPRYQGVKETQFERIELSDGVDMKIIAGSYKTHQGSFKTYSPINIYDLCLKNASCAEIQLPKMTNSLILVRRGSIKVGQKEIKAGELAIFERDGDLIALEAMQSSELLMLNGEPINEPIFSYGPFVMNSKQEILQAIDDYNSGNMGKFPSSLP
ncbi:quercetin 2,3-dioxygenase [Halobacteriovorax marinus]|uniref:Quercetin 2,3-dioxygenase n=1 Tax=Halobacteriovorax marinus TaxID=97084 RepID=A0A1Y5FEY0_9BACT|nr:quercetin 2,3-dioxygenase [Halobacteriovorax marinus]